MTRGRRGRPKAAPPVLSFIGMFLSSKEVFGQEMPVHFLRDRIRTYGWKSSVTRLAQLAAYVQHPDRKLEEVLRRTVDPILQITGDARAQGLIARARAFVTAHRQRMCIAHEEVISYLQHLVLVEGGETDDVPTDAELAFWMLGANCHLGEWAEKDSRDVTLDEMIIATKVRGHVFNRSHNWAALAVRTYELFRECPEDQSVEAREAWQRTQDETFGAPFARYYKVLLAPLLAAVHRAGDEDGVPSISLDYWKTTGADLEWVRDRLNHIGVRRDDAAIEILAAENARDESGRLHAPALLRRKPLLIEDEGWLVTSEAAMATLFHTGPWGAYLSKLKEAHGDRVGFMKWSSAFGVALERYCASLARKAAASPKFRRRWRFVLPSAPGAVDEIEDVVLVEDDHAVLFSIKSSLLPEGTIHRAKSQSAVIDWLDRFLFLDARDFKGALRKLSANIDELRRGDFETIGVPRSVKVFPSRACVRRPSV
jgi:hypothetical protein